MSEPTDSRATTPNSERSLGERDKDGQPPRKRHRVRLSCLECRRRKLSCDRGFPCERCVKSGTPELCSYETRPGLAPPAKNGLSQAALSSLDSRLSFPAGSDHRRDGSRDFDRIRRLELEVAQLKNLISRQLGSDGSTTLNETSPPKADTRDTIPQTPLESFSPQRGGGDGDEETELRFFRGKEFKTRYYGPHNALMAFSEVCLTVSVPFPGYR